MAARACVLAGVAIGRAVAAQRRAAFLAGAQMHPRRANLDALLAHAMLRQLYFRDRREVCTGFVGHAPSSSSFTRKPVDHPQPLTGVPPEAAISIPAGVDGESIGPSYLPGAVV